MSSHQNTQEEYDLASAEKALGEPVSCEATPQGWRIRTNLIIVSVLSIAIILNDLRIGPDSSILGLKIIGLNDDLVREGLFWITLYLLLHFLWSCLDSFQEWRLRITGTKVTHVTVARLAGKFEDYPNDPRQSTLYYWWKEEARKIGNINEKAQEMISKLETCEESLNTLIQNSQNSGNLNNALKSACDAREETTKLVQAVNKAKDSLDSSRIHASLKRFDQWFLFFLKSQNLRWLLFDFLAPILLGLAAISLLSSIGQKLVCLIS